MWVFGYGSLINYNGIQYPVMISGLKRSWHVRGAKQKQTYLGVEDSHYNCNGVLIKVSPQELDQLIKREEYYTMKLLTHDRIIFKYTKFIINKTDLIYCFYSNSFNKPTLEYPINRKYLNICIDGCYKYGDVFFKDFFYTTYHWKLDK